MKVHKILMVVFDNEDISKHQLKSGITELLEKGELTTRFLAMGEEVIDEEIIETDDDSLIDFLYEIDMDEYNDPW